jgi:carotenoid 1,2-hydratase
VGGLLPAPGQPDADRWALLRGREHPSRRGRADGRIVRTLGSRLPAAGPRFDVSVGPGGYAWWYIDATSADGQYGLTIIAFIGSVFSPYYKFSGRGDPENHCAINVAFNGPRGGAWAMTERGRKAMARGRDHFAVGPSAMHWGGDTLVIDIAEISAPLPYKVRGQVRVRPEMLGNTAFMLDPAGKHRWHPVAPRAHVEVEMSHPGMRWSGPGYFDSNFGDEPLEAGFDDWHWSRAHLKDHVAVMYEGKRAGGAPFDLALRMDHQGNWHDVQQPATARLPRSNWLIERLTRADAGHDPRVTRTWIDAPFYARSALATRLFGEDVHAVHESLSLRRFRSPIIQSMLPYRMPRAFR